MDMILLGNIYQIGYKLNPMSFIRARQICDTCNEYKGVGFFAIKNGYFKTTCMKCKPENYNSGIYAKMRHKNRMATDPNYKLRRNLRSRFSSAFKNALSKSYGLKKPCSVIGIIGCTIAQFKTHIQSQFQDGMSWNNYGASGWVIDHKFPISACQSEAEMLKSFHYTNMQPLWYKDNRKKSNQVLEGVSLPTV